MFSWSAPNPWAWVNILSLHIPSIEPRPGQRYLVWEPAITLPCLLLVHPEMPSFHPCSYNHDHRRIYELVVRQEPKQARMCGVGGKGIFQSHVSSHFTQPFFSVADRRPIDPPPIVQLRVIDPVAQQSGTLTTPSRKRRNSSSGSAPGSPTPSAASTARAHPDDSIDAASYAQSFLQNPYYFMFASLARPDDDAELHWLKVK